ncbi:peptide chain release factor N(5)-glutamine methyltransferase [Dysgonomonas sp. 521]|uniref:peptide chain release factor N(5)-glutamine methyltransferase n=1 Tax=Dysgonomonas sp. 521 TaxID=2302932 RepID=UPI0013D2BE45|nr:peptide chain release factor N(5)-glutamine methyltransferase [Dysgonomonas sp. 521]NDV93791.1 peptide chain release factor N(5)-glutamine methyltransferase [Dysgonomonas sp. 521]
MQNTITYIKESLKTYYPESEILGFVRIITEYITGKPYSHIIVDNQKLSDIQQKRLNDILEQLKEYKPIQYITGESYFFDLLFFINKDTLVPRPETEELVELILNENEESGLRVLDIGTGSGAIAIALASYMDDPLISAWDFSQGALDVAILNAEQNEVEVDFEKVDVLKDYPTDTLYDIIVSNPPYIMEGEKAAMDKNVLEYEPHTALFVPDNNALLFYDRIADIALNILKPDGKLYFEINQAKGKETVKLLEDKGFRNVSLFQDLNKNDRMVRAEKS